MDIEWYIVVTSQAVHYNVGLVRVIIVAVEKQYVLHILIITDNKQDATISIYLSN